MYIQELNYFQLNDFIMLKNNNNKYRNIIIIKKQNLILILFVNSIITFTN
jgi:hypothetical protein